MRKKIAAGNWKMNLSIAEGEALAGELALNTDNFSDGAEMILAPPFTHLYAISQILKDAPSIHLAAQNMHQESSGAFTGEISASMLLSAGCSHVLIGHSERRQLFGESHSLLRIKVDKALSENLIPIFCFGELLGDREAGNTEAVLESQIRDSLFHLDGLAFGKLILAYEPVWAIGTGKTASPEQAQEAHAFVRNLVRSKYGDDIADEVSILYGGSVKPGNALDLFSQADIDGGLVGGASLEFEGFLAIAESL